MTTPTIEPTQFYVGESVSWTRSFSDYPAGDGWLLSYVLAKLDTQSKYEIGEESITVDGDGFSISLAPATSASWLPGTYQFQGFVETATERKVVYNGTLVILPSLLSDEIPDTRTRNRRMYEQLTDCIEKLTKDGVKSYAIGNRQLTYRDLPELRKEQQIYAAAVMEEEGRGVSFWGARFGD